MKRKPNTPCPNPQSAIKQSVQVPVFQAMYPFLKYTLRPKVYWSCKGVFPKTRRKTTPTSALGIGINFCPKASLLYEKTSSQKEQTRLRTIEHWLALTLEAFVPNQANLGQRYIIFKSRRWTANSNAFKIDQPQQWAPTGWFCNALHLNYLPLQAGNSWLAILLSW